VDLAGNRQTTGLDYTVTTTDRTPPQIGGLTGPAAVIENDLAHVTANVGATHDIGVVDFYINGVMAFADRSAPFELVFQAVPAYGAPGSSVHISAIATDTSGNRGSAATVDVPVIADQPPTVSIVAPAGGLQIANGGRVTVSVRGTDDLGVTCIAYRAGTGLPQDASSRSIAPSCLDCRELRVQRARHRGTWHRHPIEATAVDRKGQTTAAVIVNVTVIDAVVPTVTITGATTGARHSGAVCNCGGDRAGSRDSVDHVHRRRRHDVERNANCHVRPELGRDLVHIPDPRTRSLVKR
jgi:hypothetical protein